MTNEFVKLYIVSPLGGSKNIWVNINLASIAYVQNGGETVDGNAIIVLTNGDRLTANESADEVNKKIDNNVK